MSTQTLATLQTLQALVSDFVRAHTAMINDPGRAPDETEAEYIAARAAVSARYEATVEALKASV